jgi:Spy/CpxP family protein refolding chaperone
MPVTTVGRLFVAVALLAVAVSASAGEERTKWWQSEGARLAVGLTDEQSRQLESIFQVMLPQMRADKEELDRQEKALSKLMADPTTAEIDVSQAIDRVGAARAKANKTRLLMLYRMHRLLTPAQREKLDGLHRRQRQNGRHSETRDENPARR